ncbi:MAG: hypothetical protein JXR77_12740, partial [Lentisphaeria bacterium]|nr:hypothetical protein [Lentisphaeria bacterium]
MRPVLRRMAVALGAAGTAFAGPVLRLPVSRDVWLSSYATERRFNMGAAPRLKLKIHQEFALVDVDCAPLDGRPAREAWLHVKPAGGHRLGLNGGTDLTWLVVSTVSHDWVEGHSRSYAEDPEGGGATFLESSFGRQDWGWPGATLCDVTLGNGNTLRCAGRLEPLGDGWLRLPVEPRLVHALQAGASHGLLLMDGATGVSVNCTIASRESGEGPFLLVAPAETPDPPPAPVAVLEVAPAPDRADREWGAACVQVTVPEGAFAYDIRVGGDPMPRWQVPFADAPGRRQEIVLCRLPPDRELDWQIRALARGGRGGPWHRGRLRGSPALGIPPLPAAATSRAGGAPPALGPEAVVWAAPAVAKFSPVGGRLQGEAMAGDPRRGNAVWDGAARTVFLHAGRGDIVSFQLLFEGRVAEATVTAADLAAAEGILPADGVRLWRTWYVGGYAELALPLVSPVRCPWPDNGVPGQTLQALTVDVAVPPDQPTGLYKGNLMLTAGEASLAIRLETTVHSARLPASIHFNPELNCYGGPGRAGSD